MLDKRGVHDQLLGGYADPYTLPDKYTWRFYAYHLVGAKRLPKLRPLLLSYRWLDKKLSHTDPNALIDDCDVWLNQGMLGKSVRTSLVCRPRSARTRCTDDILVVHACR